MWTNWTKMLYFKNAENVWEFILAAEALWNLYSSELHVSFLSLVKVFIVFSTLCISCLFPSLALSFDPFLCCVQVALHLRPIQSLQMHQKPLVFVLNSPQPVLWKLRTEKLVSGVKRIFHVSLSCFMTLKPSLHHRPVSLSFLPSTASEPTPSTFSQ